MWQTRSEKVAGGLRSLIERDGSTVSYAEALAALRGDVGFRSLFLAALADAPFSAFRWETPPVTVANLGRPFEFVLLDSKGSATRPEPEVFAEYFGDKGEHGNVDGIVEFPNLGGDAILVVPCPLGAFSAYAHLAAFVREAPEAQTHALWRRVGEAMERRINDLPVWLSTAGGGVSWLHVRLDDRPKYYRYAPYRA